MFTLVSIDKLGITCQMSRICQLCGRELAKQAGRPLDMAGSGYAARERVNCVERRGEVRQLAIIAILARQVR
jgi:hypothetical protein